MKDSNDKVRIYPAFRNMFRRLLRFSLPAILVLPAISCSSGPGIDPERNQERLAEKYNGIANQYSHQESYIRAMPFHEESIALDPGPEYYYSKGRTAQKATAYDDAVTAFKQAVRLKDNFTDAWYNLALCYEKQGKLSDARLAYKKYNELIDILR